MAQITWGDIKKFANELPEEWLQQPAYIVGVDRGFKVTGVCTWDEDMINPSGEGVEPRSAYLPGGEFYEDGEDMENESIVARKGEPYIEIDGK